MLTFTSKRGAHSGYVRIKILNECFGGEQLDKVSISRNGSKCPAAKLGVQGAHPPLFHPNAWLAKSHDLHDSREKIGTFNARGCRAGVCCLSWGYAKACSEQRTFLSDCSIAACPFLLLRIG